MFERFDDGARRAVVLSQEQARLLGHNWIGTEHLLLGLLALDGPVSDSLEQRGVTLEAVRNQIEEVVGPVDQPPGRHIPFTPRSKMVLELSLREALRLGDPAIAPAHVLLGLLREGQGMACQSLVVLGVDLERLRELAEELAGEAYGAGTGRAAASTVGIDDVHAVVAALKDALGEDIRLQRLTVVGPDQIRLVLQGPNGVERPSVLLVLRDGRWTVGGEP